MSSRRSKRKPLQKVCDDQNGTEVKKRKRKAKGLNDEQMQGCVASGIQRSSRLKSAKAVNYREEENSSGSDEPVERDDREYENTAEEYKDFDLSLKRSAKKASVRRVKAKIKEDIKEDNESSDSENYFIKTNVSFEVSKLKTEINLSSDEESDIADNSGRGEKEGCDVAIDASGKESHLPTSDCKQDVDVKVNIRDEKTPSKILKRKTSLFEESDGEDEDFVKDEEKESLNTGAKREKKAVVKIKRLKVTKGPKGQQEEESVLDEQREDEIAEPRKRPKRKCRKSPVKTIQNKNKQKRQPEGIKKEVENNVIVEKKGKKQMNKTKQKKIEKSEKSRNSQANVEDKSPTINTEMIDTDAKDGGNLSESSDEEWEDVEDIQPGGSPKKKQQTESAVSSVVEIDIEMPGAAKKKRRAYDWADYYRRQLNRFNKDRQIELHKIHLLCLLANGFHRNKVCNEPLLQATALSLIPPDVLKYKPKTLSTDFVYKLLFWFMKHFPVTAAIPCSSSQNYPVFQLMQAMQNQKFSSVEEVVIVFVLCIRALGGDARLVFSLQPMTWKADVVEKNSKGKNSKSSSPKSPLTPPANAEKSKTVKKEQTSSETPKASSSKAEKRNIKNSARQKAKDVKKEVRDVAEEDEQKPSKKREAKGGRKRVSTSVTPKAGQIRKLTKKSQSIKYDSQGNDGDDDDDFEEVKQTPQRSLKAKGQRSSSKKGMSVKSQDNDDDDDDYDDFEEVKQTPQSRLKAKGQRSSSKKGKSVKERNQSKNNRSKVKLEEDSDQDSGDEMTTPKRNLRRRKVKKATTSKSNKRSDDEGDKEEDKLSSEASNYSEEEWIHQKKSATKTVKQGNKISPNASKDLNDSDSDFDIETLSMKKRQNSASKLQKNYKILSSDSDNVEEIAKKRPQEKGIDVWCEVFVPAENMWVSVDCSNGFVNKPHHLEALATKPLLYVVGFDKDNSAKDITQRYAKRWMAYNIKLRIEKFDENWWSETLGRYKSKDKKRNRVEDEQMEAHNLDKPLPKSIVEYKNHPMYALERHLLKFEGIYPPTAAVLGYCRREPVYSRDCIHTLKSKHTWMKEARVVKDGEQPYKFVKKLVNPFKRHLLTPEEQNQMLDIYGEWQTEDYIPPPAKDGIVPRNEYGNVELFKPCMLPKGTVHLQIPGLNRVANKLDIDCAPAMMGWEFHKRFACPILDGFVVCEEVADVLVAAWEEEKVEQEKKRKLKREQRAMKNWKHIIKSIMIRERLKEKYQLEEETEPEETKEKGKGKGKKVQKTKAYWPQNKMTTFQGDASNLLPFEKKSAKS